MPTHTCERTHAAKCIYTIENEMTSHRIEKNIFTATTIWLDPPGTLTTHNVNSVTMQKFTSIATSIGSWMTNT